MASILDRAYAHAPLIVQNAMVSAFGARWHWRRFGPGYRAALAGFLERSSFTAEQWREYQTCELRKLLHVAVTRVPFYQVAWRELALDERAIEQFSLDDLKSLPILEKEATRAEPDAFCLDGLPPRGATVCPTSGSTGTPVRVYFTNSDFRRSLALREARACRPANVSYRLPRATFSGRLVEPDAESRGPFHRFNVVERQVYFSAFHLSPQNAEAYVEPLRRHGVVWGTGYTHAWEQLAGFMLEQNIPAPPTMRAVITTSEKLTSVARARIEQAFACRVYEEYGTVEDSVFACQHGDGRLRLSPDAGIVELVRPDGSVVDPSSDEEGQTVTTGFIRRGQLFIRYRLGDVARWDPAPDHSGLAMPIFKEVLGRIEDVVEGPDGRRTVRFHGIFTELDGVREAQVIQESRNELRIKVVPSSKFGEATVREITARVHARLTNEMVVVVESVDSIPRTAAGKFQAVINRVPR